MNLLERWDIILFKFINHDLSNPFFDALLPIWRNKLTWIPLYIIIIFFIIKFYKQKSIFIILAILISVGLTDYISSGIIKPYFMRIRPCHNSDFANWICLPNGIGHGYSFISSHASNHFALMLLFVYIFKSFLSFKKLLVSGLIWASGIAFAQVYIGYHYPSDVFLGAILGIVIGGCAVLILKRLNMISS